MNIIEVPLMRVFIREVPFGITSVTCVPGSVKLRIRFVAARIREQDVLLGFLALKWRTLTAWFQGVDTGGDSIRNTAGTFSVIHNGFNE